MSLPLEAVMDVYKGRLYSFYNFAFLETPVCLRILATLFFLKTDILHF